MADFGLGNFAGRLSADELRAALAAAGGNPDALDLAEPALQGAPPPAVEPPPPAPEQPAPVTDPEPLPAEEPKPDMSVKRARGGPAKAIDTYQQENLEDANRRIALAGESGDQTGQDAASYDAQAEISGRQAKQAQANVDDARTRVDARREHEARYQVEADRIYEQMRANAQPPPQSTLNKVLGIVGAVASMGGNGRAGQGLSMLTSMLGSDQERWAAEQQANSRLYQAALSSVGSDREGASHDIAVAQGLTALEAHEIDAALEQVKAMGLSRNVERIREELQLKFRGEVRNGLIGMEREKAKAAAARGASMQEDALWRMPLDALKQLGAGGGLSELGQKVLAQRVGNDQKDRGGEADIKKKLGEAGTGEGQEVLPGMVATVPLERKDVSDIRANAQTLEKIKGNYAELTKIRERNRGNPVSKWTNKDDAVLAGNIISEMTGTLNQFSGRGAPSNLELEDMKKQLLDPTDNYVLTDPAAVYRGQVARLERNFQAGLDAVGVRPVGGRAESGRPDQKYSDLGFKPGGGSQAATQRAPAREAPSTGGPGAPPGDIRETLRTAQDYFDRRRSANGPGGGF